MTYASPPAIPSTMAGRRAKREMWDARHPADPESGLVCIYDEELPIEHRRTKAITGVRRVRHFAYKNNLMTAVAEQSDDGPIIWYAQQPVAPPLPAQPTGFMRRWPKGAKPARSGDRKAQ